MTELEAAEAIRDGKLSSPYRHSNMTLFSVRVTGTGMAYRDSLDEFVWRDPSLYLNDEFLRRVSGLPLIWEHPVEGSLTSKEFSKRIIGALMFGFIRDDEVWGIARVYDDEAIKLMSDGQLSTSPGVVFGPSDGNVSGTTTDGDTLLVEGRPSTLCHLAVCAQGVWDKGEDPTGVQNDTIPETDTKETGSMADEKDDAAAADKARHDASAKLDEFMDAMRTKMDSMHSKLDSFEKEKNDAKKMDSARKDKFGHRKDGESYADYKKRHDADEKELCDAIRNINDGADEKDCMDSARKDRHDAEEEEKRHDKDFDKWAKEEEEEPEHKDSKKDAHKKDASKKDAEGEDDEKEEKKEEKSEKEEEKPDSRKDSAAMRENEELKARLVKLESFVKGVTTEVTASEKDALASAQSRADAVMAMLGDRSPPPMTGESSLEYRRRLLKRLAPHSPTLKNERFDGVSEGGLMLMEDRIYADAANSARDVSETRPGMLIPFEERDPAGRKITRFHGDIGAMMAPFVPSHSQRARINSNLKGMH